MMPNMAGTLSLFGVRVQMQLVRKGVEDFEVVEGSPSVTTVFQANMQPMPAKQLIIKSEGQRALNWYNMWCRESIPVGEYVKDSAGFVYRIMQENNWGQAGYHQYELTEATKR